LALDSSSPHKQDKKLGDLPVYKALLTTFLNKEIIPWGAFEQIYAAEITA
jgi:hypothetical protein